MITKKEFCEQVEKLMRDRNVDVMDAILKTCEVNQIEPEGVKRLLTPPLKEKLQAEAEKLKLVNREKSSRASLSGFFSK